MPWRDVLKPNFFFFFFSFLFFNQLTASIWKNWDPNTQKVPKRTLILMGLRKTRANISGKNFFSSNGLTGKRWKMKILYLSCFGAGVSGSPMIGKSGLLPLKMCIMFGVVRLKPVFFVVVVCLLLLFLWLLLLFFVVVVCVCVLLLLLLLLFLFLFLF